MKLTLEHIEHYLSSGLYCINEWGKKSKVVLDFSFENNTDFNETRVSFLIKRQYKLLLHPLSEFKGMTVDSIMVKIECHRFHAYEITKLVSGENELEELTIGTYKVMCKNQIDFNNLIENGLAIDINTVK